MTAAEQTRLSGSASSSPNPLVADDVQIVRRLLAHIDAGTTDEGEVWREPVENYLDPRRFADELRLLRSLPSVFMPSAAIPNPGDRVERVCFGTPLFALLTERAVDTLIVTGGSTSNCVRATAVDAASRDFRTIVVAECVFDRFELSHLAALFDLDRQYADVVSLGDALEGLRGREPPSVPPHAAAAEPERVRPPGSG